MDIELPSVPLGVITLIGLFAPYLIAIVNSPKWSVNSKRLVSIVASLLLALIGLGGYYLMTQEPIPNWPVLLILGVLVTQTSYALITKKSAKAVEESTGSH